MATDADSLPIAARPVEARAPCPWHHDAWVRLTRDTGRLPHALLISGPAGLNKTALALRLAQALLCERPETTPLDGCDACSGCHLLRAGNHPDLLRVEPADGKSQITVDQVRELGTFLTLRPHQAVHKIVVLTPAEAMNINAANSLLKVLEEPPAGSLLILVSSAAARLTATVRSRCARVEVDRPTREEGVQWLMRAGAMPAANAGLLLGLAGGSPPLALELAEEGLTEARSRLLQDLGALLHGKADPVACANRWKAIGPAMALDWLYRLHADLVKLSMGCGHPEDLSNPDIQGELQDLLNHIEFRDLQIFTDVISSALRDVDSPLDNQLMLEDVLIHWSRLKPGSSTLKRTV